MATFVLIPGAGGVAWYWHLVADLLVDAGHEAIAVDLPADDPKAGLADYADRVADAIDRRRELVVVAQSLGGFTAPLVCARVPVEKLVFVNAMIPVSGELVGAWWENTGATDARIAAAERAGYPTDFDDETYFFHDVSPALVAKGAEHQRAQSNSVFAQRCVFGAWPNVPIHVIAGRDDRFFPIALQQRVARERLGVDADILPGGHLLALANPGGVAGRLLSY